MTILAIDTSCDETSVAVTQETCILSNVIWSQAALHAQFGGVMPSLAQRQHEERIDFVVDKAMTKAQVTMTNIDAIAVTCGPGLAIALGVGINKAKELAEKFNKPLIAVNHIEGHLLSPMARPENSKFEFRNSKLIFPALGMVISGGHTELVLIEEIGKYKIIAETVDDALGEALDKAARMLGLGYPGAALLEKMAKSGKPKAYPLPRPMAGREDQNQFSYSGLKTAMYRLVENIKQKDRDSFTAFGMTKEVISDLAASFQNRAFEHLVRVSEIVIRNTRSQSLGIQELLVGGGVAANVEVRKRLRALGIELGIEVHFPYTKKLYGDNAAMIGIAAGFKAEKGMFTPVELVDRNARWRVDETLNIKF